MAQLAWHVEAAADLAAAAEFIARDSPVVASLFAARIIAAAEHLS
jgi:plasmid stabilization system protein ParE